jgi:hypothetical protein
MKIDYDSLQSYLNALENNGQPTMNTQKLFEELNVDIDNDEACKQAWFYLKLLGEQDLIECIGDDSRNFGFSFTGDGGVIISIRDFRLTILGHQILESMNNETLWTKIKEPLKKIGVEGLKQIPSLAIKLIEAHLKNHS